MPNHVINEVLLHGIQLNHCAPHLFAADGRLTFSILLPLPLNFWAGNVSRAEEDAFPGTQLDAARSIWGTKWDAYSVLPTTEDETGVTLRFQTAWNHPRGWVCAVFNTLKCDITANWLSEGGASAHMETYVLQRAGMLGGPDWKIQEISDGTEKHRQLHKLLWGVEAFDEEAPDA